MQINTVKELLFWSYANLAMAHAALTDTSKTYTKKHFTIRSRLYSGLQNGSMQIGSMVDDERLKMVLPQACCYCGSKEFLAADHLIPRKKGGKNTGDNLVWACRTCNSSKCATDVLEWLIKRQQFPPLLLLRRYLKLVIGISQEKGIMTFALDKIPQLPFTLSAIPTKFPQPKELMLWVINLPEH